MMIIIKYSGNLINIVKGLLSSIVSLASSIQYIAISIEIIFIVLSLLRQILEPKLVSVNRGLNPLATLGVIFIEVQVKGIIGIIFCIGLVMMHQILKK